MPVLSSPVTAVLSSVPTSGLRPDPDQARTWLEDELRRQEYQQSLTERLLGWLSDIWEDLSRAALGASSLATGVAIVLLLVFLVLLALVLARVRRTPSGLGVDPSALLGPESLSPDEHRARSEAALDNADYDTALVEAFRALASRSLRRGVVTDRPALTAHELADDLAVAFPAHADDLFGSAARFDAVFYGDQPASDRDARNLLKLDDALRRARIETHRTGVPASLVAP